MNAPKKTVVRQSFVSTACLREGNSINAFKLMQQELPNRKPIREGGKLMYDK